MGLSAEGPMGDPGSRGRALTRMPDSGQYPNEKTLNQQIWDKKTASAVLIDSWRLNVRSWRN